MIWIKNRMNKKITFFLYYMGLFIGTLIINYILKNYLEYADRILEGFGSLDKIEFIKGQELFVYLFLKRIKQLLIFCFIYFYISKVVSLCILDFYYASVKGIFLSLVVYYYGPFSLFLMSVMLIPCFLCFAILEIAGWYYFKMEKREQKIDMTNIFLFAFIVAIFVTIVETIKSIVIGRFRQ